MTDYRNTRVNIFTVILGLLVYLLCYGTHLMILDVPPKYELRPLYQFLTIQITLVGIIINLTISPMYFLIEYDDKLDFKIGKNKYVNWNLLSLMTAFPTLFLLYFTKFCIWFIKNWIDN